MAAVSSTSFRSIRNVALPVEHGGWAFLFEPILLGLLLAPSLAGFLLGISGLGLFLLYQPTQIAMRDRLRGKRYPRTVWAERLMLLYATLAVGGLLLALLTARAPFWSAILLALPFAGLQMLLVLRGRARQAITEISGAVALAGLAPAIVLANGGPITSALALWLVPAVRAFTSILYIRVRLRRLRGENPDRLPALAAQGAGLLIVGAAWIAGLLPVTAPIALLILAARAVYGLFSTPTTIPVKYVGFQEVGFGLLTVLLVRIGC